MIKRASDGMVLTYGEHAAKLTGHDLTEYMTRLNDYLNLFEKVGKRLRNEQVTRDFVELFAHEGAAPAKKDDFLTPDKLFDMRGKLEAIRREYQFRAIGEPALDLEHGTYSLSFTDSQGAERKIDWALANAAETRQLLGKYAQLAFGAGGNQLEAPFLISYASQTPAQVAVSQAELDEADEIQQEEGVNETIASAPGTAAEAKPASKRNRASQDPVEKKTPREVFDYVIEQGRKEYQVQRYKGLGEMTAPQLWETTMDPERRTLMQVKLEDIAATEEIFTTLMGEDVESRRKFIEENALDVKNLDI
jgi:DNA gyrase subunit B